MFLICNGNDCIYLQGLKTGMYYLRTKPAANAIQFTVDKTKLAQSSTATQEETTQSNTTTSASTTQQQNIAAMVCSLENKDECLMCGS